MQRISISWIIEALKAIDNLSQLQPGKPISNSWACLFSAKNQMEAIYNLSVYRPYLRISFANANNLNAAIEAALEKFDSENDPELTDNETWLIQNSRDEFRMLFLSELSTLPAYLVSPKGSHDVEILIELGTTLFPDSMVSKAPETNEDALEAGRCLAYERNTACGFHTFRVVEAVLRRYWDAASDGATRPHPQTLGNITAKLKKDKIGDVKVVEALIQLNKLHRNPIAHPEVILDGDEAIATLGMARSVITHMLGILPDVPTTTGAALLELSGQEQS